MSRNGNTWLYGAGLALLLVAPGQVLAQHGGDDVPVVENGRTGSMRTPPTLTQQAEMGQSGADETLLYQPGELFFGPDGNIYVTDRGNSAIFVYDRDGGFVRRIGGQGSGPGEFRMPMNPRFNDVGLLEVEDPMNQRTNYYTIEGEFVGSDPMGQQGGGGLVMISGSSGVDIGGGRQLRAATPSFRILSGGSGGDRNEDIRIGGMEAGSGPSPLAEIVDADGNVLVSIGERIEMEDMRLAMEANRVILAYNEATEEVALVYRNSAEIKIYDAATGAPRRVITRQLPFEPRVPEFDEVREASPDGRSVRMMLQVVADVVSQAAAYDAEGRLWVIAMVSDYDDVQKRQEEGDYTGMVRLEVYDADGGLLSAIVLDEPADRMGFDEHGDLWLLDTQYEAILRRFEVHWP